MRIALYPLSSSSFAFAPDPPLSLALFFAASPRKRELISPALDACFRGHDAQVF
jgi:hypothetical protein